MTLSVIGENNAGGTRDRYSCSFSRMIEDWRTIWHTRTNSTTDPIFPFGFVQVSSIETNLLLKCQFSYQHMITIVRMWEVFLIFVGIKLLMSATCLIM